MFTKFSKTPVMSTYLLAFVVSKFLNEVSQTDSYSITIYNRPDQGRYTGTALQYGGSLIDIHSKFTGISYQELGIDKMTYVGLPHFGGGMENWGLITFE